MFSQDDRDFLKTWVVDPLSEKINKLHTEESCIKAADLDKRANELSDDMKLVKKQIYVWCGGLGALVFVFGVLVTFMRFMR